MPTDGQTFSISDGGVSYTFEFDSNGVWHSSNHRIQIAATGETAASIAQKIAAAINSVSWIPAGLSPLTPARKLGGLDATANYTPGSNIIDVDGPNVTIDLGTSKLLSTLQDNLAYEIGTDASGKALADGSSLNVPKGVTIIFDAGVVVKLSGANIYVGSSGLGVDHSLGSVQVLGVPNENVYFTSYWDAHVGTHSYTTQTPPAPAPGDWGGLVFNNSYDYQEGRTVLETAGIFLDYVNDANMSYGGGKINVNGVVDVYDPIDMIEARPTVSFSTITRSADAAMSADPNSLEESEFHDSLDGSVPAQIGARLQTSIRTITPASAPTCATTRSPATASMRCTCGW